MNLKHLQASRRQEDVDPGQDLPPGDVKATIVADSHTPLGLLWNLPMAQPDFRGLVAKGPATLDPDTDADTLLEPAYMAIARAGWLR